MNLLFLLRRTYQFFSFEDFLIIYSKVYVLSTFISLSWGGALIFPQLEFWQKRHYFSLWTKTSSSHLTYWILSRWYQNHQWTSRFDSDELWVSLLTVPSQSSEIYLSSYVSSFSSLLDLKAWCITFCRFVHLFSMAASIRWAVVISVFGPRLIMAQISSVSRKTNLWFAVRRHKWANEVDPFGENLEYCRQRCWDLRFCP